MRWATPQLHDIDLLAKMVDPALDGLYPAKSLSRFADIIAICVQVLLVLHMQHKLLRISFFFFVKSLPCSFRGRLRWPCCVCVCAILFFLQSEPEFRPPMSEVVQQLVRLMQRASIVRRQSDDQLGYSYRVPERDGGGTAGGDVVVA